MGKIAMIAVLIGTFLLGACSDDRRSASPSGFYGEFGGGTNF